MLQRLLIDKMENRILVGITMFVATMLLVGWVAINENARMESFDRHFNARAIERGAHLFAANCSTCHGVDGLGAQGRAPALNSPLLFGHDFLAPVTRQMEALDSELATLEQERIDLATELTNPSTTAERIAEIEARLTEIGNLINGPDGISTQMAALQEEANSIVSQLQPAVDAGYPLSVNEDGTIEYQPSRLGQLAWGGDLNNFLFTTLVHGRPTSISYWGGNQMVAWSQRAGGPLRDDELRDLVAYIQNWDKGADWTVADALAVRQYPIVPGVGGAPEGPVEEPVGREADPAALAQQIAGTGDAARGERVYEGTTRPATGQSIQSCAGCHSQASVAPPTEAKWDAVITERLELPQFAGYTVEQYLIESIIHPEAYIVPPYAGGMPATYGDQLSARDLADILAYLHTYSQLDPYVPPAAGEATPEATAAAGS